MPRCSASVDISTTPTTSSLEPKSPWSQMASQGFASGFLQACKVCDDSSLSSAITAPRGIQRLLTHIRWCSLQRPSYQLGFPGLENHATDASKSVDADLHRHCNFDNGTRVRGCTSKNGALQPHEMCEQGLPLP